MAEEVLLTAEALEKRREQLAPLLIENASYVALGSASPERIDEINILEATREAMNEAARGCPCDILPDNLPRGCRHA